MGTRTTRRRLTAEERQQMQIASLRRARQCKDHGVNIAIIHDECRRRGYSDIRPGENVLTFNAWKALGRKVKKGEKGIGIPVYFHKSEESDEGSTKERTVKTSAHVFHECQTEPAKNPAPVADIPRKAPAQVAADLFGGLAL